CAIEPEPHPDLPRRILPGTALQNLPHDDVIDRVVAHTGALDRTSRSDLAKVDGAQRRETAIELPKRGSGASQNDGLCHAFLLAALRTYCILSRIVSTIRCREPKDARDANRVKPNGTPPPRRFISGSADPVVVGDVDHRTLTARSYRICNRNKKRAGQMNVRPVLRSCQEMAGSSSLNPTAAGCGLLSGLSSR